MKRILALSVLALTLACTPITVPPVTPTPPTTPIYSFGIVVCAVQVPITAPCHQPIVGASIAVNGPNGYTTQLSNQDGYALFTSTIPFSDIKITAQGYLNYSVGIQPPLLNGQNITLCPLLAFPAPPTRDEITQAFRDLDMNGFRA